MSLTWQMPNSTDSLKMWSKTGRENTEEVAALETKAKSTEVPGRVPAVGGTTLQTY